MHDDIDWDDLPKGELHKIISDIYKVIKAVAGKTREKIPTVIDQSLAGHFAPSPSYDSNMRRGTIRADRAKIMYEWLGAHHFDLANETAPHLFDVQPPSAWEVLVAEKAFTGKVTVVPVRLERAIAERPSEIAFDDPVVRLMQHYYFELTEPKDAYCVAFEGYQSSWHPLSLGQDARRRRIKLNKQSRYLPSDEQGRAITLVERSDGGEHQFVFVISPDKTLPTDHLQIAKRQNDLEFELHAIKVFFV
ncbi:hypothetical protein [Sulfitobacter pacificus]|uniref:hypothetical protein n=1 Tax=Sulfitobacter pacificus TaxID=1499314 RepID=UPI0031068747